MKTTTETKTRSLQPLRALWPFTKPYRGLMFGALFFLLLATAAALMLPQAAGQMIDHGFSKTDAQYIDRYFYMLLVIAVLMAIASAARYWFVTRIGEAITADLRAALYQRLLAQEAAFYESTQPGELVNRLSTDTELVQTLMGGSVSIALRHTLMLVGSLILLVLTSPKLSLLIVLGIPAVVAPIFFIGRHVQQLSKTSQDALARTSGVAGEALSAMPTVMAYAREDFEAQRYQRAISDNVKAAKARINARALLIALVILMMFGAITLVLWAGAKAVLADQMSGGALAKFVLYAVTAAGATGALAEVVGEVQRASGAMARISELLQRQSLIVNHAEAKHWPVPQPATLSLQNLSFAYPSRPDRQALRSIDLQVPAGSTLAVVGRSGAGKSTLFQLLLRFYDAQSGRIEFGGRALSDYTLTSLRNQIAIVPQDPILFACSVAENIAYGNPGATQAAIENAARLAEAHDFISDLPEGYQTFVGERGVRLSGGQQQRIAIARAILKDAPLLLLDEATSALDAQSERAIQTALERLMEKRTVRQANRIVVLDQGRIIESGTHDELIAKNGTYRELAELQFQVR
jgi:ATP-binding cassette, subfamily B, bacterial